ncbi:MAG: hypothetical protein A4S14_05860 [Proteobacteria bacterium SG_bin9]|nr:MAG: hypothetical protein A4S14_05860 [Proteobacteria bacterium SG_bin9]
MMVPALGYAGYLGKTVGSDVQSIKTGVVPADYTFAIWSFIFLFCFIYALEQARPSRADDPLFRRIGWLTAAAFVANTVWSVIAQLQYPLIYTGLVFLVTLFTILPAASAALQARQGWRVNIGIGSLAGWVSIAIFANWSVIAKDWGWGNVLTAPGQALLFLTAACVVVIAMLLVVRAHIAYWGATLWALVGLMVGNFQRGDIIVTAGAAVWLAIILLLGRWLNAKPA